MSQENKENSTSQTFSNDNVDDSISFDMSIDRSDRSFINQKKMTNEQIKNLQQELDVDLDFLKDIEDSVEQPSKKKPDYSS